MTSLDLDLSNLKILIFIVQLISKIYSKYFTNSSHVQITNSSVLLSLNIRACSVRIFSLDKTGEVNVLLVFFLTSIRFIRYKITDIVLVSFVFSLWINNDYLNYIYILKSRMAAIRSRLGQVCWLKIKKTPHQWSSRISDELECFRV